ncbi:MAG: hypothetical protein LBG08_03610 [Spirochaetaceae bacterium]|jgi:hypothetical protein|nr:hypothetical protein [Spirochaetaceae bacterium]
MVKIYIKKFILDMAGLSQNFSSGKAALDLEEKSGLFVVFFKALPKTNRILGRVLVFLIFLFPGFAAAEDRRTLPVTMYLIIDGSESIKNGKDAAAAWINDYIVDKILQEGDDLTIWIAAEKAKVLFSESLSGTVQKETVKALLRSVNPEGAVADYTGAFREVLARESRRSGRGIPYTLLVSGTGGGLLRGNPPAEFLRYSKVQEFSGWRVQAVGLGLGPGVQKAVSGYMSGG